MADTTPLDEKLAAPPAPGADPAMVAIPTVIAGAVGLFLTTVGFVPASAGLAAIPVILAATCLGLLIGRSGRQHVPHLLDRRDRHADGAARNR
jgi:hypothetical protein